MNEIVQTISSEKKNCVKNILKQIYYIKFVLSNFYFVAIYYFLVKWVTK